jgi:hypothetical protein
MEKEIGLSLRGQSFLLDGRWRYLLSPLSLWKEGRLRLQGICDGERQVLFPDGYTYVTMAFTTGSLFPDGGKTALSARLYFLIDIGEAIIRQLYQQCYISR